ncbi:hypothetical protein MRB53_012497 [Persea americana]|uniref:Uncharacterized protein n=1 Tax=Persea americana TaxID=3435 RepID=A0ACC2LXZ2_PERAE|nr:hypothetical protein MRB53_012497 [Persea americana]|eukprot:TRINITY_DN41466_c0_g1_i1.p1 TRINITY_DN41466_c0_g1~~TRINITY_DN41466_c0_g1_i1.p1  ORF type:complete len:342 (+),score=76.52 TRINITY_DN41466_c0_g1_i1:312-1337(+)
MEDYSQLVENATTRGSFPYGAHAFTPNSSVYGCSSSGSDMQKHPLTMNSLQQQPVDCFPSLGVKMEGSSSQQMQGCESPNEVDAIKAKIMAHPQYCNLLEAYMNCQKVGAPPEVMARLTSIGQDFETKWRSAMNGQDATRDPELDQFMEAYCDMLVKYREELTRPLQEAMDFMKRVESQLMMLTNGSADEKCGGFGSQEEDQDCSGAEADLPCMEPHVEDNELKHHLLKKYSGYLGSLKQELSKKKKKGKLPKDARQKLLNWWELHYRWPYPSETEKVALAECTGLDQKQINNWFINQRKRHWRPSEDMQFVVMDGLHHQNAAALYMESHYPGDGSYRLGP